MRQHLEKYKELIVYGVCGAMATLINILAYQFLAHIVSMNYLAANALAWILAFLFAYYSNSRYVFGYSPFRGAGCGWRFLKFFGGRIFTGLLDMVLMWLLVDKLVWNDSWSKIAVNILVIILNYIMSKLLIFKGERT